MIEIIDNLVPQSYLTRLQDSCRQMPWFAGENISGWQHANVEGANTNSFQFGFSHQAFDENGRSTYYETFLPLLYFMEDKTGIKVNELYRIRVALNTFTGVETQHHPHVDMETPHKVLLYYVNDSDGDTFMYNEMFFPNTEVPDSFTIKEKITPKANRAVVFDGFRYHSSSKPTKNPFRFIVNFDFN
jgi:hypothetical protein